MFENVSPDFCRKYIINDQFRKTGQKITTFVQFCNKRKYIAILENCICKQTTPKFFREIVVSFSRRKGVTTFVGNVHMRYGNERFLIKMDFIDSG